MKVGTKFRYDGNTFICTKNDGFIVEADCLDEDSFRANIMWIGGFDISEVEILEEQ